MVQLCFWWHVDHAFTLHIQFVLDLCPAICEYDSFFFLRCPRIIKVVPYSEIRLVFMFNGGSSSSPTICPTDKKMSSYLPNSQNRENKVASPDTIWHYLKKSCLLYDGGPPNWLSCL